MKSFSTASFRLCIPALLGLNTSVGAQQTVATGLLLSIEIWQVTGPWSNVQNLKSGLPFLFPEEQETGTDLFIIANNAENILGDVKGKLPDRFRMELITNRSGFVPFGKAFPPENDRKAKETIIFVNKFFTTITPLGIKVKDIEFLYKTKTFSAKEAFPAFTETGYKSENIAIITKEYEKKFLMPLNSCRVIVQHTTENLQSKKELDIHIIQICNNLE